MNIKLDASEAEKEVLEMLWKFPEGITQSVLLECMNDTGKEWKRQTLNTFITRLEKKGLVKKGKRQVFYTISKEDYYGMQIEQTVEKNFGGRISNLVLAFCNKKKMTEDDVEQLSKIIEAYEKEEK